MVLTLSRDFVGQLSKHSSGSNFPRRRTKTALWYYVGQQLCKSAYRPALVRHSQPKTIAALRVIRTQVTATMLVDPFWRALPNCKKKKKLILARI